jgi:hypothetical protein
MFEFDLSNVNNFLYKKQHLSKDAKIQNIVQATKDIWGLHATIASTPYISLFNRVNNFTKQALDREILEKRLIKTRSIRKTVYIIPKENVPIAFSATKESIKNISEKYYKNMGINQNEYEATSNLILDLLGKKGMSANEIRMELKTEINLSPIINYMCDLGILVRGLSKAGWKSNSHTYFRMDEYLPDVILNEYDQDESRKKLVFQYLSSFGPSTINDISWWAAFPKTEVNKILDDLGSNVEYVNISGYGEHIVSAQDVNILNNIKENNTQQINLLPALDPYIMGYKGRDRYLDKEYYSFVFDRSGSASTSIMSNEKIVGVWDFEERPNPVVKFFTFEDSKDIVKEVETKAKEIGNFIYDGNVTIKRCHDMVPLDKRTTGSFMSPLKDMNS